MLVGPGWKPWARSSYSIPPSIPPLATGQCFLKKSACVSAENLQPLMLLETERTSGSILPWDMGEEATTKPPGRYFTEIAGSDFCTFLWSSGRENNPRFLFLAIFHYAEAALYGSRALLRNTL